ncbi:MAG: hypothetical protein A2W90_08715 [Bacteroidetes bacterium GWF2_42_66]|nr:MAG: hypothetical protein A2W92_14715 [Bacteroidetes bacterium GWA2_42_15]OFX96548.1 MAG: hypothetical protein A2W89_06375 [Bacteroidetes bacterium GWE2_42_39]OFY40968.1 MAG: hypothetical protein A2W90_08715 [Bacteroidetes bacterium GWF2_42_66]HAZ03258.1 hypothetical protein [Marinilabiliales bacterium]HBL76407.1 hypothetical protein [Prolixibacteraceae bacterium]
MLFLSIKGRINFSWLERYRQFCEQRYWQQFQKAFEFMAFNKELVILYGSDHYVIVFNPSYINKSGKRRLYLASIGRTVPKPARGDLRLEV